MDPGEYERKIKQRNLVGPINYLVDQHHVVMNQEVKNRVNEDNQEKAGRNRMNSGNFRMDTQKTSRQASIMERKSSGSVAMMQSSRSSSILGQSRKLRFGKAGKESQREKDPSRLSKEQLVELMLKKKEDLMHSNSQISYFVAEVGSA